MAAKADRCAPCACKSSHGRVAHGPTANIFVGSVDADMVRNVHEIFKADSTVTRHDGVPANVDIIAELHSTTSGDDNVWIDPDPRAERNFAAVDNDSGTVDQDIFAESREAEGL